MSNLPAVRLPSVIHADGEDEGQEPVVLELPPSNKFSFAWPSEPPTSFPLPVLADKPPDLSSSDQDSSLSESESNGLLLSADEREEAVKTKRFDGSADESEHTPTNRLYSEQNPMDQAALPLPLHPRLSRAFSVPLPSQVDHLKNPRRMVVERGDFPPSPRPIELSPEHAQFHELSLELADSVQMVIQMLLQLSPPQVLDPAKEQFSACSLPIPTPSITAMFTSMKNLNYMSANIASFSVPNPLPPLKVDTKDPSPPYTAAPVASPVKLVDFDIGETLQSVGDAVSGIAADAGIDLVLFHGDVGMKHIAVRGDESGLSYTLSHIVRQVISTAHRGDCIEISLHIVAPRRDKPSNPDADSAQPLSASTSPDPDSPLHCTFTITHVFLPSVSALHPPGDSWSDRDQPSWNSHIFKRLIQHIDASFGAELSNAISSNRTCKLSLTLDRGSPSVVNPAIVVAQDDPLMQALSGFQIAGEPTLEELGLFIETLRGKKVSLYASSKGEFTHHLTSYLTAWGLDVSHISSDSIEEEEEGTRESPESLDGSMKTEVSFGPGSLLETLPEGGPAPSSGSSSSPSTQGNVRQPSFILIDDDISVLRSQLRAMKPEQQQPYPLHLSSRKRPSLSAHHRPRSSPQVARAMGLNAIPQPRNTSVIIHFTSLANFKLVKGILQTTLGPNGSSIIRLPEVIVIPKPAGPRRVLTALHTAATKPTVDPFFSPIATSPMSPSVQSVPSFPSQSPRSPHSRPGHSPRSSSEKSLRSPKDHVGESEARLAPPSPLGLSEGLDYFSEAAVKLGTSPSSGLVIQSPDGQPAGIFFHPKARAKSTSGEKRHSSGGSNGGWQPQFFAVEKANSRSVIESPKRSPDEDRDRTRLGIAYLTAPSSSINTPRRSAVRLVPMEVTKLDASPEDAGKSKKSRVASPMPNASPSTLTSALSTPLQAGPSTAPPSSPPQQSSPLTPRTVGPRKSTMMELRKVVSPPHSPRNASPNVPMSATASPTNRRASIRRGLSNEVKQVDKTAAANGSGAGAVKGGQEATIVPPISVLVVDDNPINQTILSTFMKKKRIKYDVAKNGQEAVEKWKSGRFHLILMDIQMPVMDGITATKEIRRLEKINATLGFPSTPQSEGARTPSESDSRSTASPYRSAVIIVALTASSLQSDRVAALAAGCNDFLTKPVSLIWLNSKIIEWGSIKALQMWADIRPEVMRGQSQQAQNVARKLHVPEGKASSASPQSTSRSTSQVRQSSGGGGSAPAMPALVLAASGSASSLSSLAGGLTKGLTGQLDQILESPTSFEFPRPSSREDTSLPSQLDAPRENSLDFSSRIRRLESIDSTSPRISRSGTGESADSMPSPSFSSPEKTPTPVTAVEDQSPRSPVGTATPVTALEELSPRSPMAVVLEPPTPLLESETEQVNQGAVDGSPAGILDPQEVQVTEPPPSSQDTSGTVEELSSTDERNLTDQTQ